MQRKCKKFRHFRLRIAPREVGMQTFDQALFDLYEAGMILYEDALRNGVRHPHEKN